MPRELLEASAPIASLGRRVLWREGLEMLEIQGEAGAGAVGCGGKHGKSLKWRQVDEEGEFWLKI